MLAAIGWALAGQLLAQLLDALLHFVCSLLACICLRDLAVVVVVVVGCAGVLVVEGQAIILFRPVAGAETAKSTRRMSHTRIGTTTIHAQQPTQAISITCTRSDRFRPCQPGRTLLPACVHKAAHTHPSNSMVAMAGLTWWPMSGPRITSWFFFCHTMLPSARCSTACREREQQHATGSSSCHHMHMHRTQCRTATSVLNAPHMLETVQSYHP